MGIDIQVVYQGGGARVVHLLAAYEALHNAEEDGKVSVKAISGTSAGAIIAALHALRVDPALFRQSLESEGPDLLRRMPAPNILTFLLGILRRKSIWDINHVRKLLEKHISPERTFADTNIPLSIVCSDLRSKKSVTYSRRTHERDFIINAVLDSISIPLAFKVWDNSEGQLLVDGGLCENLPVSSLDATENLGKIVAFGFQRRAGAAPKTALQFLSALLEVAIANSEDRARLTLAGHRFCPISTRLGTFDFEAAVKEGLKDGYKVVTYEVTKFLETFAQTEDPRRSPSLAESLDAWDMPDKGAQELMLSLGDIFYSQHANQRLKYHSVLYEITAAKEPSESDTTKVTAEFEPLGERVYCSVFGFDCPPGSQWTRMMQITMENLGDSNNKDVALRLIPIRKPGDPNEIRRVCAFFQPPLEPGTGPYRLTIFDQPTNLLGRLRRGEEDEIGFAIPRADNELEVRFVLYVPNEFPPITLVSMEGGKEMRPLTSEELYPYRPHGAAYAYGKAYGWICQSCPREGFTVKIKKA